MNTPTFYTPCIGDEDFVFQDPTPNAEDSYANRQLSTAEPAVYNGSNSSWQSSEAAAGDNNTEENKWQSSAAQPTKPLSAYALFFRDTVSAIKAQNPSEMSFAEISKIVDSMWEALDIEHKKVYKRKALQAKLEYQQEMTHKARAPSQPVSPATYRTNPPAEPAVTAPQQPEDDKASLIADLQPAQTCMREGCSNPGVVNPAWDDEYCSNECVVDHCRNVFNSWVKSNFRNG